MIAMTDFIHVGVYWLADPPTHAGYEGNVQFDARSFPSWIYCMIQALSWTAWKLLSM
jgi:hypothetical protein